MADDQCLWRLIIAAMSLWDVFCDNWANQSCIYCLGLCVKYVDIKTFFFRGSTRSGGAGLTDCRGFTITLIGPTTLGRITLDE